MSREVSAKIRPGGYGPEQLPFLFWVLRVHGAASLTYPASSSRIGTDSAMSARAAMSAATR